MDILCKSNKRELENEYILLLRSLFNKYYKDTLNKDIMFSVLEKRPGINIGSHIDCTNDILYKLFSDITYIISHTYNFALHCICIHVDKISINDDYVCKIINIINKNTIFVCKEYITQVKKIITKPNKVKSLYGLSELCKYKKLSHDVEGIIGNYIEPSFSEYNYDLINLLNHKYSETFTELYNTSKKFIFFYWKYSDKFF